MITFVCNNEKNEVEWFELSPYLICYHSEDMHLVR